MGILKKTVTVLDRPSMALLLVALAYVAVTLFSLDHCYFWDNIQQTSKEGHWFFLHNFESLFLPGFDSGSDIVGTGYHPPLMGMMTALLWKLFGTHLWVSHVFVGLWALWLAYVTYKLVDRLVPQPVSGWLVLVLLFEPTVLAQLSIASPDIILLASFVTALWAIVESKRMWLAVALLFLVLISGRGMFAAAFVFVFDLAMALWHQRKRFSLGLVFRRMVPYVPVGVLLVVYFGLYFARNGWFFGQQNTQWGEGWESPENLRGYVKNLASYALRLLENGRVVVWGLGAWLAWKLVKSRRMDGIGGLERALFVLIPLFFVLYLYFAMTTKIVILPRYYMPMFFVLTLLVAKVGSLWGGEATWRKVAAVVLLFLLTGHFWVYPDKTSKAWDATLAHWHFYGLRKECHDFIESRQISPDELGAGFCLYGNQRYVDLRDTDYVVGPDTTRHFFVFSNISNIDDETFDNLNDTARWRPLAEFRKGFVWIKVIEKQR